MDVSRRQEVALRTRSAWYLFVILPMLGLGPGCGSDATGAPQDAAALDGRTDAVGADARPGGDGPPADGGVATASPFVSETAGGGRLTSETYRLELFVTPSRPVGAASTNSYRLTLGPGAVRAAR